MSKWCYYSAEDEMAHMKTFKEYGEKFEEHTLSVCYYSAEAAGHSRQDNRPAEYSQSSDQFIAKNQHYSSPHHQPAPIIDRGRDITANAPTRTFVECGEKFDVPILSYCFYSAEAEEAEHSRQDNMPAEYGHANYQILAKNHLLHYPSPHHQPAPIRDRGRDITAIAPMQFEEPILSYRYYSAEAEAKAEAADHSRQDTRPSEYSQASYQLLAKNDPQHYSSPHHQPAPIKDRGQDITTRAPMKTFVESGEKFEEHYDLVKKEVRTKYSFFLIYLHRNKHLIESNNPINIYQFLLNKFTVYHKTFMSSLFVDPSITFIIGCVLTKFTFKFTFKK